MKLKLITILLIIPIFAIGQTYSSASQIQQGSYSISGIITYAALSNTSASGYVTPLTGNIKIPAPQLSAQDMQIKLSVYPNPATSAITAKIFSQHTINSLKISIIDAQGRALNCPITKNFTDNTAYARITVNSLTPGIYSIVFIINDRPFSFKIIKK